MGYNKRKSSCIFCHRMVRLTPSTSRDHILAHIGEKPYNCRICSKSFSYKGSLLKHKETHLTERPFECVFCKRDFKTNDRCLQHIYRHTQEKPYDCIYCEKSFPAAGDRNGHELVHTGELKFQCDVCSKSFKRRESLIGHRRIHTGEKPFKCSYCGKRFTEKSNLVVHVRIHTGEKPYQCKLCNWAFSHLTRLKKHMESHLRKGENPFKCEVCPEAFQSLKSLETHQEKLEHHKYYCRQCRKVFETREQEKAHKLIHSKKKVYPCELCDEIFTYPCRLNDHVKRHMDGRLPCNKTSIIRGKEFAKNYQYNTHDCDICGEKFEASRDLRLHKLQQHKGRKLLTCGECGKLFDWQCRLKEHMEKFHS